MDTSIGQLVPECRRVRGGFEVSRVPPASRRRMVGPFIFFDRIGPAKLTPPLPRAMDVWDDRGARHLAPGAFRRGMREGRGTVRPLYMAKRSPSQALVFPRCLMAGSYSSPLIDLDLAASFNAAFRNGFGGGTVDGARNALLAGMTDGTAYFNIHTNVFPAGEIRGFLHRVPGAPCFHFSCLVSCHSWPCKEMDAEG